MIYQETVPVSEAEVITLWKRCLGVLSDGALRLRRQVEYMTVSNVLWLMCSRTWPRRSRPTSSCSPELVVPATAVAVEG